jgi:hypothetical protein
LRLEAAVTFIHEANHKTTKNETQTALTRLPMSQSLLVKKRGARFCSEMRILDLFGKIVPIVLLAKCPVL